MLDETLSKTRHEKEGCNQYKEKNKTVNEVKPIENINKNPHSFQEISHIHKEVPLSQKLQDHACD